MSKIFENCLLVKKLPKDDPECVYVNRMMEMPSSIIRELNLSGESYISLHGVVPTNKLPSGYNYGNINTIPKNRSDYYKTENKTGIKVISQNSSNSNSTIRMESDEHDNETNEGDVYTEMIETVKRDILLSDNDDGNNDDENNDDSPSTPNYIDDTEKLLFETLNACSKKLPNFQSLNTFQRHYTANKQNLIPQKNDKISKDVHCDTESSEMTVEEKEKRNRKFMNILEYLYKKTHKNLMNSYQPIYDCIKEKKRKLVRQNVEEKDVTDPKLLKLSMVQEKKKDHDSDNQYRIYFRNSDYELSMNVIPDITKDINFEKMINMLKVKAEVTKQETVLENCTRQRYLPQDSIPFNKSEISTKSEIKQAEDNSVESSTLQSLINNQLTDNTNKQIKKPEAAAKQVYLQSTHSTINSHPKVAVVTGNVNKTQTKVESTNRTCTLPSLNINSNSTYQRTPQNQSSSRSYLQYKESNDNEAEESKIVQGLVAMKRMRTYFKSDFLTRMRNLDVAKWLTEVRSLKEKASNCKRQLDYAPQIMVYIRKNLFYNYSLEVKTEYRKSHHTYLENAAMVKQCCSEITQTYMEYESNITDTSSVRHWNIRLVRYFTVVLCHKLSAILQYRAFRNVYEDCRKIHDILVRNGIIDRNDRLNQLALTDNNHQQLNSPFSSLSPYNYEQMSTRSSSPRLCNFTTSNSNAIISSNNGITTNLTQEMKMKLQRYVDQTNIINTAYSDWMLAEFHLSKFCISSSRHDESWKDFEWKIVEKTGGVIIDSINESVPFVIKYLEGYINHMNEFMKQNL